MVESSMVIEQFDFSHLQKNGGYVQINIHVGKLPASKVKSRLLEFKQNSRICEVLRDLEIPHDIVPFREFETVNIIEKVE